jgi:hypothetical protein
MDKKIYWGLLIITLLSTGILYVQFNDLKLRLDKDKTTFYNLKDSRWRTIATEYTKLYNGTKLIYRDEILTYTLFDEENKISTYIRDTKYKKGEIISTYLFDGKVTDIELVPISETHRIIDGKGLIFQYEVRDLSGIKETYSLTGEIELHFGKIKINLAPGYYWGTVYKSGIVKVKYKIKTDDETYNIRLFDPSIQLITANVHVLDDTTTTQINSEWLNYSNAGSLKIRATGYSAYFGPAFDVEDSTKTVRKLFYQKVLVAYADLYNLTTIRFNISNCNSATLTGKIYYGNDTTPLTLVKTGETAPCISNQTIIFNLSYAFPYSGFYYIGFEATSDVTLVWDTTSEMSDWSYYNNTISSFIQFVNADPSGFRIDYIYGQQKSYIKFNTTNVTGGSVSDAKLCLYLISISSGCVMNASIRDGTNNWTEETLRWNYSVTGNVVTNLFLNTTNQSTFVCWNVSINTSLNNQTFIISSENQTSSTCGAFFGSKEATSAYNPYLNITYTAGSNSPPTTPNLGSPANNSYTSYQTLNFDFNATDAESSTLNCILYINSSNYGSNATVRNNTNTIIKNSNTLLNGTYSWNISCSDGSATNWSVTRIVNINYTINYTLTVNLMFPANFNQTLDTTPDFIFNFTDDRSNANCSLRLDSGFYGTNKTVINHTKTTITANSSLSIGLHSWYVECNDTLFKGTSSSRNITILSTPAGNLSVSLCYNISFIQFTPNLSLYNQTSKTITQYNITPVNHTICDFNITNTGGNAINVSVKTNATSSMFVVKVNGSVINAEWTRIINNFGAGQTIQVNTTIDYINANRSFYFNYSWEIR